jgi:hypothetical protein
VARLNPADFGEPSGEHVAAQVVQDGFGADDRALGEDDPALGADLAQEGGEGGGVAERLELALELEFCRRVELEEGGAEFALEHGPTAGTGKS